MILAEIGNSIYVLPEIEKAEQLLKIMGEAKLVRSTYVKETSEHLYFEQPNATKIEISIKDSTEIYSHEEAMRIKEEKEKTAK